MIPDKVPDSQGSEIFPLVPAGEAGDGPGTFIFPDLVTDLPGFSPRNPYFRFAGVLPLERI